MIKSSMCSKMVRVFIEMTISYIKAPSYCKSELSGYNMVLFLSLYASQYGYSKPMLQNKVFVQLLSNR